MGSKKKKEEKGFLGGLLDKLKKEFPHPVKKAMDEAKEGTDKKAKENAKKLRDGFNSRGR